MAWSTSAIFRQWLSDELAGVITGRFNSSDVFKAALYNNTGTPDKTVTSTLSAYNAATSQWVTANEVTDATNWTAGGRTVTGTGSGGGFSSASGTITFDGADTAGGGNVTITNAYGDLLYDSTLTTPVANQGCAFHYFGGAQSVTAGTFTIVWNAAGLMQVTV